MNRTPASVLRHQLSPVPDLESDIHDLTCPTEIAYDAAMADQIGGKTLFAIEQFERMAKGLKEKFNRAV